MNAIKDSSALQSLTVTTTASLHDLHALFAHSALLHDLHAPFAHSALLHVQTVNCLVDKARLLHNRQLMHLLLIATLQAAAVVGAVE